MAPDSTPRVHIGKAWRMLLLDLGLSQQVVLRRAGLAQTVLDGKGTRIPLDDFYRLVAVFAEEADDPLMALKLGQVASVELFDPAFFAAICSPDMNTAAQRLGEFKRLVGAFSLDVDVRDEGTTIGFSCKHRPDVPVMMGLTEMVFLTAFTRRATRHPVKPVRVSVPEQLPDLKPYEDWFGCPLSHSDTPSMTLAPRDATRPFITHDEESWQTFEPQLRRRMDEARQDASTRRRVEQVLFELLPSGRANVQDAARELAMSSRTLQRRLNAEGTSWLEVLNSTRERLARHYLKSTEVGPAEVSFLLGFEDPNSLFRAFQRWTGTSPEAWRAMHRQPTRIQA